MQYRIGLHVEDPSNPIFLKRLTSRCDIDLDGTRVVQLYDKNWVDAVEYAIASVQKWQPLATVSLAYVKEWRSSLCLKPWR